MRCIGGIGASPDGVGPLRVVSPTDVLLEVKRQQQYWPVKVYASAELYVPGHLAARVHAALLDWAAADKRLLRGSWVRVTGQTLEDMVRHELAVLAPGVKALTPAERLEAAERWLDKRWG